ERTTFSKRQFVRVERIEQVRLIGGGKVLLLNIRAAISIDGAERLADRIVHVEGQPARQVLLRGQLQCVVVRLSHIAVNVAHAVVLWKRAQHLGDGSGESGKRQLNARH